MMRRPDSVVRACRDGAYVAVVIAVVIAGLAAPVATAADPLGRLFLTPEQRTRLEARRQSKVVDTTVERTETEEVEAPTASFLSVQGEVVRSSGKKTVFINGVAYSNQDAPKGVQLSPGPRVGEVMVTPSETAAPVELKVGQTLDKNSLTVNDALQRAGSITIGRQAATKSKGAPAAR